ncbi:uncharacterized protein PHACADRAFT_142684 [Phanerochaete carnosa HHB-10118-sp]|uniref:F-box domain-containing protein n=1 Tax=Phanerochaete carnosa (strain HHB-10118-sp) TaxID=650164 RepID=K5V463_PHACS|nr:uncharacterized protein PHACADRAFT_142684 [Phanerochaete carnosa HHB-10118-sp]EKM57371.1 hypothetical protein PHACADRAFT_142684 [Phanerochaete carnosa HHB-10118-sp]
MADEVCVLCGIRPFGGPTWLCSSSETHATRIAKDICDAGAVDLPLTEVKSNLLKAISVENLDFFEGDPRMTVESGYEDDCIAIGYFDSTGSYAPCRHHGRPLHPTGDDVRVRRVNVPFSGAKFTAVITIIDGERQAATSVSNCNTMQRDSTSSDRMCMDSDQCCNVWVHLACHAYLEAWLDCAHAPRLGRHGQLLSLTSELYEIVASRRQPRVSFRGALPSIDYGGTLEAFMGVPYQDYILGTRKGARHIAKALREGIRNERLIPAILEDCRLWMFVRPDIWPIATPDYLSAKTSVGHQGVPQPHAAICALPLELLPVLLQYLNLEGIFALARTCKDLHASVLDRATLTHALRLSGANVGSCLHWLMPVPSLREEWEAACEAMNTWLPPLLPQAVLKVELKDTSDSTEFGSDVDDKDDSSDNDPDGFVDAEGAGNAVPVLLNTTTTPHLPLLPLFNLAFPLVSFLRACARYESMRARRRRWELIKQWDTLFTNYRRDGWDRDEFCRPGTTWAVHGGTYQCQCEGKF